MLTPKAPNKSNSNSEDMRGRTLLNPNSTPFEPTRVVSNVFDGNNERHNNNIDRRQFNTYFPRSHTNVVGLPSGVRQTQGSVPSVRNTPQISANELSEQPFGAPMPLPHNQYQDVAGQFGYMRMPTDPNVDDDGFINDLHRQFEYYYHVSEPQRQPDFRAFVDHGATQHQTEHLAHPQQYAMGRSPGFVFGAINSSHYPPQQVQDYRTRFSFPTPGINPDLHFHGSGHVQQSEPLNFYNPLRGKEVINPEQGSHLGHDDHGLLGLLKTIKGVNPAKTALAMGVDQHSLGLELNSSMPINQKFASPWSDEPSREGPNFNVPECYNSKHPPPLKGSHFKKFNVPTLFYIFYSMPKDQAQLFAANELHDRGWCYHKELLMWFTRERNSEPTKKSATYEIGSYIYFDPTTWQTTRQDDVVLFYEMIEKRPVIPR